MELQAWGTRTAIMRVVCQAFHVGKWKSDNIQFQDDVRFDSGEKQQMYWKYIHTKFDRVG